jgi:3alpha(or 20beta)-hydroxysteroid dehydrogenase
MITGASRGQGAAAALLFAEEGARVVVADVIETQGREIVSQLGDRGIFVRLDVGDEVQWKAAVDQALNAFGSIDVLLNNAGIYARVAMLETSAEDYMKLVRVNALGVFLGMKSVANVMIAAGKGSIVNTGSAIAFAGAARGFAYAATKWAVRGMTKSAAIELAPHGIRVNSIHPGLVLTDMVGEQDPDTMKMILASIPLGKPSKPADIAQMALFLASDESWYCTGADFVVDGGRTTVL